MQDPVKFEEIKRTCRYCGYRFGGCVLNDEEVIRSIKEARCRNFIIGDCYSCVSYLKGECSEYHYKFWPTGCDECKKYEDEVKEMEETCDGCKYYDYEDDRCKAFTCDGIDCPDLPCEEGRSGRSGEKENKE